MERVDRLAEATRPPTSIREATGCREEARRPNRRGSSRRSLALSATGSTISSKREDLATIRAMLALAEARGWTAIAVRGSTGFQEAWIEATVRGLDPHGYKVTALDRRNAKRSALQHRAASCCVRPSGEVDLVRFTSPWPVSARKNFENGRASVLRP